MKISEKCHNNNNNNKHNNNSDNPYTSRHIYGGKIYIIINFFETELSGVEIKSHISANFPPFREI